jgi:flagellar biosynthetic protein FlhB
MPEQNPGGQERTESPTPRRRARARDEGRVARSTELSAAAVLLASTGALATLGGPPIFNYAVTLLKGSCQSLSTDPLVAVGAAGLLQKTAVGFLLAILPFAFGMGTIVLLVNLIQARGVLSWKPVSPKLSHISVISGFKRIFSMQSIFTLFKSLAKLTALALVTFLLIKQSWPELVSLAGMGPSEVASVLRAILIRLAVLTGLAFLLVAAIDYAFQWFRMEKSLRMTKQELKYESRESEGDPHIKSKIRQLMRATARRRMLQQVPAADFVVVNPTEIAVAVKYDTGMAPAPVIVAMGQRKLAFRIRELALRSDVPVIENRLVARALLATGKVGRMIPPALYAAVAEILAYVYRMRGLLAGSKAALAPEVAR